MALLSSSAATPPIRRHFDRRRRLLSSPIHLFRRLILPYPKPNPTCSASWRELGSLPFLCAPQIRPSLEVAGVAGVSPAAFRFCQQEPLALDAASLAVKECESDDELLAAVRLRVRTFYDEFDQSSGDQVSISEISGSSPVIPSIYFLMVVAKFIVNRVLVLDILDH